MAEDSHNQANAETGEEQTECPAGKGEKHGFHKDLTQDDDATGAKRGSNSDLFTSRESFRKHEVGDVRTSNQQNESDSTKKNEKRRTHIADKLFPQRLDDSTPALVIFGIELFEARANSA